MPAGRHRDMTGTGSGGCGRARVRLLVTDEDRISYAQGQPILGESHPGFDSPLAARVRQIDGCVGTFIQDTEGARALRQQRDHPSPPITGTRARGWANGDTVRPVSPKFCASRSSCTCRRGSPRWTADVDAVSLSTDIVPTPTHSSVRRSHCAGRSSACLWADPLNTPRRASAGADCFCWPAVTRRSTGCSAQRLLAVCGRRHERARLRVRPGGGLPWAASVPVTLVNVRRINGSSPNRSRPSLRSSTRSRRMTASRMPPRRRVRVSCRWR